MRCATATAPDVLPVTVTPSSISSTIRYAVCTPDCVPVVVMAAPPGVADTLNVLAVDAST